MERCKRRDPSDQRRAREVRRAAGQASKARRGMAVSNYTKYTAQDRPGIAVITRLLPQSRVPPKDGTE